MTIKRLSIDRRVDLIMAFYRDAANRKFNSRQEIEQGIADLRREIRRQIENAIRDDRELREPFLATIRGQVTALSQSLDSVASQGVAFELTDEQLCPSCGIPGNTHGTVQTGKWLAHVCAGIKGSQLYISPDTAAKIVDALEDKKENDPTQPGEPRDAEFGEAGSRGVPVP